MGSIFFCREVRNHLEERTRYTRCMRITQQARANFQHSRSFFFRSYCIRIYWIFLNISPFSIQFSYIFFSVVFTDSNVKPKCAERSAQNWRIIMYICSLSFFSSGKNFVKRHDAKVFQRPDRWVKLSLHRIPRPVLCLEAPHLQSNQSINVTSASLLLLFFFFFSYICCSSLFRFLTRSFVCSLLS